MPPGLAVRERGGLERSGARVIGVTGATGKTTTKDKGAPKERAAKGGATKKKKPS